MENFKHVRSKHYGCKLSALVHKHGWRLQLVLYGFFLKSSWFFIIFFIVYFSGSWPCFGWQNFSLLKLYICLTWTFLQCLNLLSVFVGSFEHAFGCFVHSINICLPSLHLKYFFYLWDFLNPIIADFLCLNFSLMYWCLVNFCTRSNSLKEKNCVIKVLDNTWLFNNTF